MQRVAREADDPVHPDHERAEEAVVLAVAGGARVAVVEHRGLLEADQRHQPAQEAVFLAQRDHVVDHTPAHQPEVPGVGGDLDVGDALDDAVADRRDDPLGQRLPRARAALGVDDLIPLAPAGDHVGDQLRRVLQVAVDHHYRVARGRLHARQRRGGLAEAAREAQHLHARVGRAQLEDALLGAVGRRVDGEDQLPVGAHAGEHRRQALVDAPDVAFLVVCGDDDRDHCA